jgi:hypothetical protein
LIVESSGPLVAVVVVPPVALLPLVVIMPPVEVVVHSVTLLPLAAVVPPVAVVYRPSPLSCRESKLIVESLGVALLSLSLLPLVRRCPPLSYRAAAASLFIVAPPLPSLSCRWFCFRRCATAAFLEATSAVDGCCVTPQFAMIFLSAVTVKLRPFLPVRVPPHASNSSPASPALATRIWMIVE